MKNNITREGGKKRDREKRSREGGGGELVPGEKKRREI